VEIEVDVLWMLLGCILICGIIHEGWQIKRDKF